MRNWVDATIAYLSPGLGLKRTQARLLEQDMLRMYEGAAQSKRTENWVALTTSANSEIKNALITLRSRARDLVRNNPYAHRIVSVITTNTVGTGIIGQIKSENDIHTHPLNQPWKAWAETTDCDYEGKQNFYSIQAMVMRAVAESGECLVRFRRRRVKSLALIQLQVLEADFLDIMKEGMLDDGGYIIQGVEHDSTGKVRAYWIFPQHPGGFIQCSIIGVISQRVPAEEILHIYRIDRPGQIRGITWLAPVMLRLKDFDDYEDAQLMRQKIAACLAIFVRSLDGNSPYSTRKNNAFEKLSPGMIAKLGPGEDVQVANPPTVAGYSEYAKEILHAIAVGCGITYEALTGDLSEVNFSSARMGWLEFQRNIDFWRWSIIIPQLCAPVWEEFRKSMLIQGAMANHLEMTWTPPRREMIDPAKEVPATIDAIRGGLSTLSEAIRERGFDPKEHLEEIAKDNQLIDELGLVLDSDPRQEALQETAAQTQEEGKKDKEAA